MVRRALVFVLTVCAGSAFAQTCRLALAFGLDVSGSVDEAEYRAQREGLAWALRTQEVQALLLAPPEAPVEIAVFEWSGPAHQRSLLGWTLLSSPGALDHAAEQIETAPHIPAPLSTAVGSARAHGVAQLVPRGCAHKVLDLSADGVSNAGPRPQDLPAPPRGITVNALVIGGDPGTYAWFEARVIHGPGAFLERAASHADYGAAMRRKLLREAAPQLIGQR